MKTIRVTKANPCPVCQKDSWCLIGQDSILCMRVQSEKRYVLRSGETGYWHRIGAQHNHKIIEKPRQEIELHVNSLLDEWRRETDPKWVLEEALRLGVSVQSLVDLGIAWCRTKNAWAFPMYNGNMLAVGIRLRSVGGSKWAFTGSKAGVFARATGAGGSATGVDGRRAYICEGPTDTAALLTIGLFAIGRPSCSGGQWEIKQIISRLKIKEVVIIADNDKDQYTTSGVKFNPGMDGAQSLARTVMVKSCIITPQAKDIREFVKLGGTADDINSQTQNVMWSTI